MSSGEKSTAVILMLVGLMIFAVMLPEYINAVQNVNTTGWTFTGYLGAKTLWLILPFLVIAGYVIKTMRGAIGR